ncbi:hypothetical protein Tco_1024142 [Tanacetum coccineum]
MEGYKLNDLKLIDFDSIQEMFDRAFKRVNTFEDFRTKLVEGKEKRAGTELVQEITKKQKVEDDKETAELKKLMEIIPDEEEVAIDYTFGSDGKSQMYMFFSKMLKKFDREDLEDLYKLLKAKFESTKPVEDLDLLLWGDLKTMFENFRKNNVWRNPTRLQRITAAHVFVNAAQLNLVLLVQNCSVEVTTASENMLEVTTASEYQVNVTS